jgi:hypothetical protein
VGYPQVELDNVIVPHGATRLLSLHVCNSAARLSAVRWGTEHIPQCTSFSTCWQLHTNCLVCSMLAYSVRCRWIAFGVCLYTQLQQLLTLQCTWIMMVANNDVSNALSVTDGLSVMEGAEVQKWTGGGGHTVTETGSCFLCCTRQQRASLTRSGFS